MTTTLANGPGGTPPDLAGRASANANRRRVTRVAFALLAPTLIAMAVVVVYPIVISIINSLQTDFATIDPKTGLFEKGGFVGLQNYTNWLLQQCQSGGKTITCPAGTNQSQFYDAIFATFFFTVVTVTLETVIGMWMALVMNRNFRGRGILRAAVLVPWAIPTAVTAQLWYFIFATNGVLNSVLHINTLWTADLWASRWAIIIADTWKTTPFMALLILAGLQLIPEDTYEAARMDGASTAQAFVRITLPLVRPALVVAILFRTLDALRMYDLPAILTQGGGGGGDATTTLSILVVRELTSHIDSASALSTITFIIIFLVAFLFIRFFGANVTGNPEKSQRVAKEA
ncbi:MAG: sugar ABC transporter permease [Acidobacteria bacterium]|nr:sugar ABC transporter permease [Acidobacteriota bacterium]